MKRITLIALACLIGASSGARAQELTAQEAGMSFFSFAPPKQGQMTVAGVSSMPWASDMAKAQAAYRKGDYVTARESLERASAQGNIIATWYLGHMYRLGRGVPTDNAAAFVHYSRVAEAFSADEPDRQRLKVMVDSLIRVADTYRKGDSGMSIAPDPARAYGMFNTAASFGHPAAHYALGLMTLKGDGVRRNPEMGVRWLMLAARKRFPLAEAALGELYLAGEVVPQDRVRALMWYNLARQTIDREAYPQIFDRAELIHSQLTDSERSEATSRAFKWAAKHPAPVVAAATASMAGN